VPASVEHALGTPHCEATPLLNKRPVCVGSDVSIAPFRMIGPPPAAHVGVAVAPVGAVAVRVGVEAMTVGVGVPWTGGAGSV
jgi:hypothetical protein